MTSYQFTPSYNLNTQIRPNTSTQKIKAMAELRACAGHHVLLGRGPTEHVLFYDDRRIQWGVKHPSEPYPRFFDATREAVDDFVDSWLRAW